MRKLYVTKVISDKFLKELNTDLPAVDLEIATAYAKALTGAISHIDKRINNWDSTGKPVNPFTTLVSTFVNRVPVGNEVMRVVIAAKSCPQCGQVFATNLNGEVDQQMLEACQMEICGLKI